MAGNVTSVIHNVEKILHSTRVGQFQVILLLLFIVSHCHSLLGYLMELSHL